MAGRTIGATKSKGTSNRNLRFISKIAERSAYEQTYDHLIAHNLIPELQSAYKKRYSTETELLKVQNDILLNMDCQHVALLVLLDLSAAFDTVNHDILLRRLETTFGITGTASASMVLFIPG